MDYRLYTYLTKTGLLLKWKIWKTNKWWDAVHPIKLRGSTLKRSTTMNMLDYWQYKTLTVPNGSRDVEK